MQINIRTSEANQDTVRILTNKLSTGTKENVIARIALAYSLQTGRKFTPSEFGLYDSKGKEYKDHILFDAKHRAFYIALIGQYYGVYRTNENIPKYIKLHIDHGLELMGSIFTNSPNLTFFDFMTSHLEKGMSSLDSVSVSLDHVGNKNQRIEKSSYQGPIKINVGSTVAENSPIEIGFNNAELYNNNHIAVAGNSGTGKTQFALEILRQISEKSNHHVSFIYLDFKGLKDDDLKNMQPFFDKTKAVFVDAPNSPFPVNPLSFIDCINETNRRMGIHKFVDIICKYSNLGVKQSGLLKEATLEAFLKKQAGQHPTISDVNNCLLELTGDRRDTLTEIMSDLSSFEVFKEDKRAGSFLDKNIYLSLSGDLSNSVRFTSLFLIINYIYNTFMNMDSTPVENGYRAMRYVLLIDEAHTLFKERKYQEILEKILREIRSKGVSVVLLSQGIEEFNQPSFDFSSMCEISFLLDVKDKGNTKARDKFLGLSGSESTKAARSLERIQTGQAISNIKEYPKGELINVSQFWKS